MRPERRTRVLSAVTLAATNLEAGAAMVGLGDELAGALVRDGVGAGVGVAVGMFVAVKSAPE